MSAFITFIEFTTVEGTLCMQRADEISTFIESTIPGKAGKAPIKVIHLLLRNNNRLQIVNETRETLMGKLREASGTTPIIVLPLPEPEPESQEETEAA